MIDSHISPPAFRYRKLLLAPLVMLLPVLLMPAPGRAQDSPEVQSLIQRINRLERDLNTVQRQLYRNGGTPPGAPAAAASPPAAAGGGSLTTGSGETVAAQLMLRMDELESKITGLTGRIEEVDHRNAELSNRLDKLVADVDFRLKALEHPAAATANAGAPPPAAPTAGAQPPAQPGVLGSIPAKDLPPQGQTAAVTPPPAASDNAPVTLPPGTPQEQYNFATRLLHQGEYAKAEQALNQFVAAHPADPLASAAQYWLGETFFVRQQYDRAAAAFLAGYQKYPKGTKAPDNLLKLAMSLHNLNQKKEACAVFKQLATEYPHAEPRIKQNASRERAKAGCPG